MTNQTLAITFQVLPDGGTYTAKGRAAWALRELLNAGDRGITSLSNPAPRLAAYIFKLKTKQGLTIEPVPETHGGPYSGQHCRYILRSEIQVLREVTAQ